eukprot:10351898-Alexandrium_andersonii.AAC.1
MMDVRPWTPGIHLPCPGRGPPPSPARRGPPRPRPLGAQAARSHQRMPTSGGVGGRCGPGARCSAAQQLLLTSSKMAA